MAIIKTPITDLFKIKHPIILAGNFGLTMQGVRESGRLMYHFRVTIGMNVAAGPELAAAVTNAGGLGVIGGLGYTPKILQQQIREMKKELKDPDAPFGVDLLIPAVGGTARKTNYDYTKGQLPELIDVIIDEKAALFVCAIGVPPKYVVDKLHAAGIPVMNMVGHPYHVPKAIAAGVDLICAQGGEGGGHTGDTPASILIPACVDACRGHKSPLTGQPIYVVGAGAVYDGRSLAANLMWGAQAVWVGTRFVASIEAAAPKAHKEAILTAGYEDAVTTLIYSGRPLRVRRTPYIEDWEKNRQAEIKELTAKGILPYEHELEQHPEKSVEARPWLIGRVAAVIHDILPAKTIVDNMVNEAAEILRRGSSMVHNSVSAKL